MKANSDTLYYLSLSRNYLTTEFIKEICEGFKEMSKLEKIELRYPKEIEKFDHIKIFETIATLSTGKNKPIEVIISNYYGKLLAESI